jgi:protein-disulfide isomerase
MKRFQPFIIILAVLVVAAGAGIALFRSNTEQPSSNARQGASSGYYSYTPPAGAQPAHTVGSETAAVTLEEFGDYQCPPCGAMFPEVKKIEAEYGHKIRFIFRQNPLPQIHRNAITAAHAAEAAGMQGQFWGMHDKLYENQKVWADNPDPRPLFFEYARVLGLDTDRFLKDMGSQEADRRVLADMQRGQALGVQGTPTFILNGRQLTGTVGPNELRTAINSALSAAGN